MAIGCCTSGSPAKSVTLNPGGAVMSLTVSAGVGGLSLGSWVLTVLGKSAVWGRAAGRAAAGVSSTAVPRREKLNVMTRVLGGRGAGRSLPLRRGRQQGLDQPFRGGPGARPHQEEQRLPRPALDRVGGHEPRPLGRGHRHLGGLQ